MSASSTSTAPPVTAIYDSKEDSPRMGKVSDAVDNDTIVVDGDTSDDDDDDPDDISKTDAAAPEMISRQKILAKIK